MWRRRNNKAERSERWQREDAAPRLLDEIANLESLKLDITEEQDDIQVPAACRTRHIVVARAPALFEIGCTEPKCEDGGHDLTLDVMHGLRAGEREFSGQDKCHGRVGDRVCGRVLKFVAHAKYSSA